MEIKSKVGIETIVNIFKAEKGVLQVLLLHKEDRWMLPSRILENNQTIEDCAKEEVNHLLDYSEIYLKQDSVFSDVSRVGKDRLVAVSFLGITDTITEKLKFHIDSSLQSQWVSIDNIPKLSYDHNEVLKQAIEFLKKEVENPNVLATLFPNEFTLPEVQKVLEQLFCISLDRRNFRKRLLVKGWISETGSTSEGSNGRPGKLYYFQRDIEKDCFF